MDWGHGVGCAACCCLVQHCITVLHIICCRGHSHSHGALQDSCSLHLAPARPPAPPPCPTRNGQLTGRQIRNAAAMCNRSACFQSEAWRRLDLHVALLTQVHRQSDAEFVSILRGIRDGSLPFDRLDDLWRMCRCWCWCRRREGGEWGGGGIFMG